VIIVDTGPLYAAADADDIHHEACIRVLQEAAEQLVAPVSVVIEAAFLIGKHLGPESEARFLRSILPSGIVVEHLTAVDLDRSAELVATYADLRLGTVDASVVAIAERLGAATIVTVDRRHFSVVRPRHRDAFILLP